MTTPATSRTAMLADTDRDTRPVSARDNEAKPSWKTTELYLYLAAVIGVLIASQVVDGADNGNGSDYFAADKAWLYITLLTIGYLVSRGLAKAGSHTRDAGSRTR